MGFKIGRSATAPTFEVKKTVRYGAQLVVATETPVAEAQEKVETPVPAAVQEEVAEVSKPKRGRKAKKS